LRNSESPAKVCHLLEEFRTTGHSHGPSVPFTLIELLVVIVIIVMQVAMQLPA